MVNERALQEAFLKIKEQFSDLKSEIESLRTDITDVKSLKETVDGIKDNVPEPQPEGFKDYVETAGDKVKDPKEIKSVSVKENKDKEIVEPEVVEDTDSYY